MATDDRQDAILLPKRGALLLLLPIMAIPLVFIAWGWFLWRAGELRTADGPAVSLPIETCPEARDLLAARAEDMGIEANFSPTPQGFALSTRLPSDPTQAALVSPGLSTPGAVEVRGENGPVLFHNEGVSDASVRLDLTLRASTLLRLTPEATDAVQAWIQANPIGVLLISVDGRQVGKQVVGQITRGEVEIWDSGGTDLERMNAAATRAVVIDHGPLPCPVTVGEPVPLRP
jgi:hypothetical protein